jgi:AcrR family transcriptional regulator
MPRARLDANMVVAAAAQLADAQGLESVTLARLAARLGVRAPSLYAHVDGLADLRRRIAARGVRELTGALQAAAAGRSGADSLQAIARAYRAYGLAHPGTYEALQRAPDVSDRESEEAARRLVDVVVAVLRGYGLEGKEALHGVRIVRAALHGFVTLEARGAFGLPLSLDESFELLVAALDRGLASMDGSSSTGAS